MFMKYSFLLLVFFQFSATAHASENHCRLNYIEWRSNAFGSYSLKHTLGHQDMALSLSDCNAYVKSLMRKYQNTPTRWSQIDIQFSNNQSGQSVTAHFVKP
jgi:hypothetical protein